MPLAGEFSTTVALPNCATQRVVNEIVASNRNSSPALRGAQAIHAVCKSLAQSD